MKCKCCNEKINNPKILDSTLSDAVKYVLCTNINCRTLFLKIGDELSPIKDDNSPYSIAIKKDIEKNEVLKKLMKEDKENIEEKRKKDRIRFSEIMSELEDIKKRVEIIDNEKEKLIKKSLLLVKESVKFIDDKDFVDFAHQILNRIDN